MKLKYSRLDMEDAAYCAVAWASGEPQQSLAETFGYKKQPPISVAIREFLDAYTPVEAVREAAMQRARNGGHLERYPWLYESILKHRTVSDAYFYGEERKAFVLAALLNFQRTRAARWADGAATFG
jgi:hypothetical protein